MKMKGRRRRRIGGGATVPRVVKMG